MQKFSYHTHTIFSDGNNTTEEMLQQAVNLGWKEIGISDHLIVHKNLRQSPSWQRWVDNDKTDFFHTDFQSAIDGFSKHVEHVHKVAQKFGIKARVGAEVDFFTYDGWQEEFIEFQHRVGLDYCISGNHFLPLENGEQILDAKDSGILSDAELQKSLKLHFMIIAAAAASGLFKFMAHLDYLRKLPACGNEQFWVQKKAIIKALLQSGTGVELSSKGIRKQGSFYPEERLLKEIISNNIPLVISDDAHRTSELEYEFAAAERLLEQLDCQSRWTYSK